MNSGAILEAVVEKGEGTETPKEKDLVYFHFTVHTTDDKERIVYSTRSEDGATDGAPLAAILMRSPRLPRAWEMALIGVLHGLVPDVRFRECRDEERRATHR